MMRYQIFTDQPQATYPIAILVPKLAYEGMVREYLDPGNLIPTDVIGYGLHQTGKKTSATTQREYLDDLIPILEDLAVEYLLVGDADYFKTLTGSTKADLYLGYVLPNTYPESHKGRFQVLYVPNYRQVLYDPGKTRARIAQALDALWNHRQGHYREPGCSIISFSAYPTSVTDIASWLQRLLDAGKPLSCDIETFSLKHVTAGIGTISFAWSKHEGIAFPVDLSENPPAVRKLLIDFFLQSTNHLVFHNISFDVNVLIYQLFMKNLTDTKGLLQGLKVFFDRSWDDTKIISYLATNSCAGNDLGLKFQSQEFAGNYAVDEIKDITKIPLPQLLEYNLVDCLATWFVQEKHWNTLVQDQQLEIYENLFKPALIDIIQMQLTGMPLDMTKVAQARELLAIDRNDALHRIQSHKLIEEFTYRLKEEYVEQKNQELKKKQITLDDPKVVALEFNPNSPPQKQALLYEMIGLPIIERTKTLQAATGSDVLLKLKAYTTDQSVLDLLDAFLDFAAVDKIYGTFIPAMEAAVQGPDGWHYLFGNFNLGGTVSGRLSSSGPNLQTIPSTGTRYAKIIKQCFQAAPGHLFIGLDFNSLEDRISALTTKDTNKIKVYTDGYDGHSLRAHSYFGNQMPDIETAPTDAICYNALVGGDVIWFHSKEQIHYLGQSMTGQELYEHLASVPV